MESGWEQYYILFLSALLALGVPFALLVISRLVVRVTGRPFRSSGRAVGAEWPTRMNTRYFLAVKVASLLMSLTLILVPLVTAFRSLKEEGLDSGMATVLILSILLYLGLALFYAARKGDLGWIQSMAKEEVSK